MNENESDLMDQPPLNPDLPFVFPDARVLEDQRDYLDPIPFQRYFESAETVMGVVHDLDDKSAKWLEEVARQKSDLQIYLILAVYPACPTSSATLKSLVELAERLAECITFRLLPLQVWTSYPLTAIFAWQSDGQNVCMMGSTPGFMLERANNTDINICFPAQPVLADHWRKHFDWLWMKQGIPLNYATAEIPSLVPAKGTEEAARLWREYLDNCEEQKEYADDPADSQVENVEVDPDSGEVESTDEGDNSVPSPSTSAGVKKMDHLSIEMAKAFSKGKMVTVDEATRIPPLDAPVRPQLLGVESFRQIGTVSQTTRFRISLIDEKTLKKINNARTKTSQILTRFSYRLADGTRWIPTEAIPLLEKELTRLDREGKKLIKDATGGDLNTLIQRKKENIRNDLQGFYNEVNPPGTTVPDEAVQEVLADLEHRFSAALEGNFLPELTYAEVQFSTGQEGEWHSQWGQALSLLHDAATYCRKIFTDSYFMRDVHETKKGDLVAAMDIFGDALLKTNEGAPFKRAECELQSITDIVESDKEGREKCEALLSLIHGRYEQT